MREAKGTGRSAIAAAATRRALLAATVQGGENDDGNDVDEGGEGDDGGDGDGDNSHFGIGLPNVCWTGTL